MRRENSCSYSPKPRSGWWALWPATRSRATFSALWTRPLATKPCWRSRPEQIALLDPDVVILRSFMADKLGRPLEEMDIPMVRVDLETPEQYFRDVATLGELFGNEARAAISRDTCAGPAVRGLTALGDGPAPDRQKTEGVP